MSKNLKDKLAVAPTTSGGTSIVSFLNSPATKAQLGRAAANGLSPDRLTRLALTQLRTNKRLAESSTQSVLACLMTSAQLGLEPGPLGLCYYVPYFDKRTGQTEAQFQLGYMGIIELARRSGQILSIDAHAVHEADEFRYAYGLHPELVHVPAWGDRGNPICYYAIAHFKDGGYVFNVMSNDDVEKIRGRAQARDNGPWVTDHEAMALKTVIKSLRKFLPLSVEAQTALAVEDQPDANVGAALADMQTGEILDGEVTEEETAATEMVAE